MAKNDLVSELSFEFGRKINNNSKKSISNKYKIIITILIALSYIDFTGTVVSINKQLEQSAIENAYDVHSLNYLQDAHKDYKENTTERLTINVDSIKKGFDNFKPQTNIGQILLLNEYVYFKNEYYKLNSDNPYTKTQIKEINDYLNIKFHKEDFNKKEVGIKCSYHISCYFLLPSFNEMSQKEGDFVESAKRKKYFELSHKEEMQRFLSLPLQEQAKLFEKKEDPYSKNLW